MTRQLQPLQRPANSIVKMRKSYDRLKRVKVDDFTLNFHEQLKNLDQIWLARLLADIAGQHTGILTEPTSRQELSIGNDSDGTSLMLMKILRPLTIDGRGLVTHHLQAQQLGDIGHDISG